MNKKILKISIYSLLVLVLALVLILSPNFDYNLTKTLSGVQQTSDGLQWTPSPVLPFLENLVNLPLLVLVVFCLYVIQKWLLYKYRLKSWNSYVKIILQILVAVGIYFAFEAFFKKYVGEENIGILVFAFSLILTLIVFFVGRKQLKKINPESVERFFKPAIKTLAIGVIIFAVTLSIGLLVGRPTMLDVVKTKNPAFYKDWFRSIYLSGFSSFPANGIALITTLYCSTFFIDKNKKNLQTIFYVLITVWVVFAMLVNLMSCKNFLSDLVMGYSVAVLIIEISKLVAYEYERIFIYGQEV